MVAITYILLDRGSFLPLIVISAILWAIIL